MISTQQAIYQVAKALERLANEHGTPNTFTSWEVALQAHLPRLRVGWIGSQRLAAVRARVPCSVDFVAGEGWHVESLPTDNLSSGT